VSLAHARLVRASTKPCDDAAARLDSLLHPFSPDARCVQNACGTHLEHVQDALGMHKRRVPDACKRYLGAELYREYTVQNFAGRCSL